MSDESVCAALRSDAALVVVEAPAGCGKTHHGADYAREIADANPSGRPLILTHTHAACSVFADRTKGAGSQVQIRTMDSLFGQIASAYHEGLGLPADIAAWVRQQRPAGAGYSTIALKVASFLQKHPMIAAALVRRHSVVICDEHQDSSGDQHALVMALLGQGANVRIFADPMQKVFIEKGTDCGFPPCKWEDLIAKAQATPTLDHPHRWMKADGCADLGKWTLKVREILKTGGAIDLSKDLPEGVSIVLAENQAQRHQEYSLPYESRKPVDLFEQEQSSLIVLTHFNATARSFRGFFNRRLPLWEGHSRDALEELVDALAATNRNPSTVAAAIVVFMVEIGKGFSPSAFGNAFEQEVRDGCKKNRSGKPAAVQELARYVLEEPDHRGVAKMLRHLQELKRNQGAFAGIEMDHYREFLDAIRLGDFDSADSGFTEITHRRTYSRPKPPPKAISTIHKAKGLECDSVILMPCDAKTFPDNFASRCLLYVALSRARKRLMLVVSRAHPSPLLKI